MTPNVLTETRCQQTTKTKKTNIFHFRSHRCSLPSFRLAPPSTFMLFLRSSLFLSLDLLSHPVQKISCEWVRSCSTNTDFYLPPVFEKRREVLFLGSVAVSVPAVSLDVLPYISVAIKASFLETWHVQYK